MSIILGIDYGEKRIGLALSDPEEKLARRFFTLANSSGAVSDLREIIKKEKVERVVIGLPLGFHGESGQTRTVENFMDLLREKIDVPLETMNEVLTSKMAEDNLLKAGVRNIKEVLDQEAARIILQDYLDIKNRG